jgi:hypothetical protein
VGYEVAACYGFPGEHRVLSLRPIALALTVTMLAPAVGAAEDSAARTGRYSIASTVPESAAPEVKLLDPSSLLPPIESFETAPPLADAAERADEILRDDPTIAAAEPGAGHSGGPLSYPLSDDLSARLDYHHALLFDRDHSRALRNDPMPTFSTRPDRDVLDLGMSWRLAGNSVGIGYQLESARGGSLPADLGVSRFLPGSQQATHAFTLGLTRRWGGNDPPPLLIEPPLGLQVDVAAVEATPTPAP